MLERLGSGAAALEAGAATRGRPGPGRRRDATEDLASRLQSLSTSGGEDAQALAGGGKNRRRRLHGRAGMSVTAPQPRGKEPLMSTATKQQRGLTDDQRR